MNAEKIKEWLKSIGRDRNWLAEKTGWSKSTIDGWLSAERAIPARAMKAIDVLMHPPLPAPQIVEDLFHVSFTAAEFEEIEEARQLAGYKSREDFYRAAVTEYAEAQKAKEIAQGLHFPDHDVIWEKAPESPPGMEVKSLAPTAAPPSTSGGMETHKSSQSEQLKKIAP